MKRRGLIAGLAIGGVAVAGACWLTRGASADVPTAKVERGSFVDAVQIRGEIKAGRSVTIIAPSTVAVPTSAVVPNPPEPRCVAAAVPPLPSGA